MMMNNEKRRISFKRLCVILLCVGLSLLLCGGLAILGINLHVSHRTEDKICRADELSTFDADCILVLGCRVIGEEPSHMLEDRIQTGVSLYRAGVASKLLMSGDHGDPYYNEVGVMKMYAMREGIPASDIFMDHAGFSTYESLYRAKEIFGAKRIVIVTQEFHLPRALYLAEELGLEAYGVSADLRPYTQQLKHEAREMLARVKGVFSALFLPEPQYSGEKIPLEGDGNITNDADFERMLGKTANE